VLQAAAVKAAQLKRQKEAAAEADAKVVPFLKNASSATGMLGGAWFRPIISVAIE